MLLLFGFFLIPIAPPSISDFIIRSFKFRSVNIDGDLAPDRRKEFFGSYSMPSGLCFYSVSSNADLLRDTTALRLYICRFQTEIYIYGFYIADLNKAWLMLDGIDKSFFKLFSNIMRLILPKKKATIYYQVCLINKKISIFICAINIHAFRTRILGW